MNMSSSASTFAGNTGHNGLPCGGDPAAAFERRRDFTGISRRHLQ
jgi:hypothetical protein